MSDKFAEAFDARWATYMVPGMDGLDLKLWSHAVALDMTNALRAENERLRAVNAELRLSNENLLSLLSQQARPLTDAEQIERYGRLID